MKKLLIRSGIVLLISIILPLVAGLITYIAEVNFMVGFISVYIIEGFLSIFYGLVYLVVELIDKYWE